MLRFFVGRCLALERDLLFFRWVQGNQAVLIDLYTF
jgi:hypothetical protein